MDQILLTFGSLTIYYQDIKTEDSANIPGCTAILDSIEKLWAKADQDVFVATVLLNPFVKATTFSPWVPFLSRAGVLGLMKHLYRHFFSVMETTKELDENLQQLFVDVEAYFGGSSICADMAEYISNLNIQAQCKGESLDSVEVYKGVSPIVGVTPPPLFKLAYHILSICPNSASCKWLFSVFGNTLTKLRNHLGTQTLSSLAELKMHIQDEHLRNGKTKEHMKRFFGRSQTSAPLAQPVSQHTSVSAPPPTDETEMDSAMDINPVLQQPSELIDKFNHITELFGRLASGDDDDGGEQMPSANQDKDQVSIAIADLFNFTNRIWIPAHERSTSWSLDEELELYELLDLDVPGEEDVNVEFDHALDSMLHHV